MAPTEQQPGPITPQGAAKHHYPRRQPPCAGADVLALLKEVGGGLTHVTESQRLLQTVAIFSHDCVSR